MNNKNNNSLNHSTKDVLSLLVLSAWLLIDLILVMPVIHAIVRRPINYLLTRTPHLASSIARAFVIDVTEPLIQTKLHKVSIYNFPYPIDGLTNCIHILGKILNISLQNFVCFFLFHLENGTFEKTAEQARVSSKT